MNSFGIDICEVCGSQSADHAGWFAVTGSGTKLEILPWTDEVRRRVDCRHACCGDHVQKLLLAAAARDLGTPVLSTGRRGGWDPEALVPPAKGDGDDIDQALVDILSAVDSILHTRNDDDEEESLIGFDA
ncbi:MAG: hypothetical protein ACRD3Q_18310 [Terriglobales bacterium]